MKKKDPNRYPAGLNAEKVKGLIAMYENQSDAEAIAHADAAYRKRKTAIIEVPIQLLPQVRRLLKRAV